MAYLAAWQAPRIPHWTDAERRRASALLTHDGWPHELVGGSPSRSRGPSPAGSPGASHRTLGSFWFFVLSNHYVLAAIALALVLELVTSWHWLMRPYSPSPLVPSRKRPRRPPSGRP